MNWNCTYTTERPKDDSTEAQDVTREIASSIFEWFLRVDIEPFTSAQAPEEKHDEGDNHPCVPFINMHEVIPDEARNQTAHSNDDNANDER